MKRLAFNALLAMAALAAPAAAADGNTEVTLMFGVSFLDARVEQDRPFDVSPYLPPNVRMSFPLPPIGVHERTALGGSALFGFGVARRVGGRAWVDADLAIAPTHHLEREAAITCRAEVCAQLTGVRPQENRQTVNAYHYGLALAYELARGEVRPYLSVGVGGVSYDMSPGTETAFSFDVGAGLRMRLDGGVGARLEVVDHVIPDFFLTGRTEHDPQVRAGISFRP